MMSLRKSIKKILKENFDDLEWADEITSAGSAWLLIKSIKDEDDPEFIDLKNNFNVKIKIKWPEAFSEALVGCEGFIPENNIFSLENVVFELGGLDFFDVSALHCREHDFHYSHNIFPSVLLRVKNIGYRNIWSFWVTEDWLDLILIPKNDEKNN